MITLGFSCYYHDSSACIVKDGVIIAAIAEERLSRIKHDNGFPHRSIKFCLDSLRIAANEVDQFVFYEKPIIKFERVLTTHAKTYPRSFNNFIKGISSWPNEKLLVKETLRKCFSYVGPLYFLDHHLSHAAGAYLLSAFDKAAIVTMDGVGEWATTTIGRGLRGNIRIDREIRFPHSLGLLYSTITAYLGFKVNSHEYEVMGLSAFGKPGKYLNQFSELIKTEKDGSFMLNMKYFEFEWGNKMFGKPLENLFGSPSRKPHEPIKAYHKDIAASLQFVTEGVVINLLGSVYKKYRIKNLCLAGGVALNSVINGKIIKKTPFRNIYIPADPGDGGAAMGAAVYADKLRSGGNKRVYKFTPYLGEEFDDWKIEKMLNKYKLKFTYFRNETLFLNKIIELLIKQKIIAWFQGRSEWGPRALGARSILADPRTVEMKDKMNLAVKHRLSFRPFAPVILSTDVRRYFLSDKPLPEISKYMLMVYKFKKGKGQKVPAVRHVDDTGRLQVISKKDNILYWQLIKKFKEKTGIPILLNTSFNVSGEPIVNSPEDAIRTFLSTKIDYLAMGHYLIKKDA